MAAVDGESAKRRKSLLKLISYEGIQVYVKDACTVIGRDKRVLAGPLNKMLREKDIQRNLSERAIRKFEQQNKFPLDGPFDREKLALLLIMDALGNRVNSLNPAQKKELRKIIQEELAKCS